MSDVTTTTTTTTEPRKGTLDDLVNLIKTIPPDEIQKLKDVFADGQITRDELPILAGVGFRNWKTLAAIVVIIATVIGGWIGYVSSPKTDAELASLIKSGFEGQSKQLDSIVKAIEAKPVPVPVDPDKKPSKGAIPDEVTAKVGRLTIVTSKETVDQWIVPPGSPCEWDADGKRLTLVPIEAVEFSVGVVTQKGKSLAWCLVKAGVGPRPPTPPDPTPDPKPDPKPIPKVDALHIVAVWESADSTPAIAKVMKDLGFWKSLEPLGVQWYQIDKDQKDDKGNALIDSKGYRSHVDKAGLPCLIVMDKTGHVLEAIRLPDTTTKIRETVKGYLGK